jgi:hypothetical protein
MLMDEPSNRNRRRRDQPCLWQLVVVLVCVLLPGCATSGLTGIPAATSRSRNLADLTGDEKREADAAEHAFGDGSKEVAAANYELVNADDDTSGGRSGRSGHSLLQPVLKPKKAVPLPFPVGQTEHTDTQQPDSPDDQGTSPWQSKNPRGVARSASAGRAKLATTAATEVTEPSTAPQKTQSRIADKTEESAAAAIDSVDKRGTKVTPAAMQQAAPAVRQSEAPATQSDARNPGTVSRPTGLRTVRREADATGAVEPKEVEADRAATPESATAAEPSMLDRFRNLYAPRAEDAAERQRKSTRRWTDPFGLLTEREEAAEPTDAEPEVMVDPPSAVEADAGGNERGTPSLPSTAIEQCIAELEEELRQWPGAADGRPTRAAEWRRRQTDLRMLYAVAGRTAESVRIIDSLPAEEQEFWQAMMMATNHYRRADDQVPREEQLAEVVSQVRTAARHLQPLAKLDLYRLQFCSRIDGFGNVTEFPTSDFEPGQRLLLYAGLRNFRSERTSEGRYRTEFAAVIEFLREEDGEVVETIRLPEIPDECDEERTDYFQSFELTAPALEGTWFVRIRISDQLGRQTAESQLKLTIR